MNLKQGQSSTLQALQDEVPEGLVTLLKIQGLGSKNSKTIS